MRWKKVVVLTGDIAVLYGALIVAVILRYGRDASSDIIKQHVNAFGAIFVAWLLVFYASRLYDHVGPQSVASVLRKTFSPLLINFSLAIAYFYIFARAPGAITPKTTLAIFFGVCAILFPLWRRAVQRWLGKKLVERTVIIGENEESKNLADFLNEHPDYGYRVLLVISEQKFDIGSLRRLIEQEGATTIIASEHSTKSLAPHLVELMHMNINFWDLASFYEMRLEKIPVALLNETWFLENITRRESRFFTFTKSAIDAAAAGTLLLASLPLWPVIALGIKLLSSGPIFYRQTRVGLDGKPFVLLKFRTMLHNAEEKGAVWAGENDPRVTPFGRILRKLHLDELPQILNILRGDMSFVGPRPERPEFVEKLKATILFYDIRHLVKPGLTGWAQLNFRYGASIEDAREKLQYDLFYIKNRSLALDISIILKTLNIVLRGGTGR